MESFLALQARVSVSLLMLRVILVDHVAERADLLRQSLLRQGYEVVAVLGSSAEILNRVDMLAPDVILADMQSPDRDTIEDVRYLMRKRPCPVVMYAGKKDSESITRAIDAGVSAYVTDEIDADDLKSILDMASARFRQFKSMSDELQIARGKLEERVNFDKAKALLIRHHGLDEGAAHKTLQQLAMNQRVSLSDAANNVIAMLTALPDNENRPGRSKR